MGDYRYNPVDPVHNAHLLAGDSSVFDRIGIGVADADQALEVSGIVHISAEQGTTPAAPANGDGGLFYTKADGKPYWRSNDVAETDLSSGGGSGDITSVVAGAGLTGGALTGDATLNVVGGAGITANADDIELTDNGVTLAKMAGLTRGSIIYGDASGDPAELVKGSGTYVLTSDGTDIAWASASGRSVAGDTDNAIMTWVTSDNTFAAEANLTFDGNSMLIVTGAAGDVPLTVKGHSSQTADIVKFQKGTTELTVIDNTGRLAIFELGSANPSNPLHIEWQNSGQLALFKRTVDDPVGNAYITVDNTANAAKDAQLRLRAANDGASKIFFGDAADVDVGRIIYDHDDNSMDFYANGAKKFTIRHDAIMDFRIAGTTHSVSGSVDTDFMSTAEIDPTEWLTIKVNGNTRYIPVWS